MVFEPGKTVYFSLKKEAYCLQILNGTPKRIRIAVYTVKGCCPRPLDDGGPLDNFYSTKSNSVVKQFDKNLFENFSSLENSLF